MTDPLVDVMVDYQAGRLAPWGETATAARRERRSRRILALSPSTTRAAWIRSALASFTVNYSIVNSCREGRERLADGEFNVIVTDISLPDGNWCDVLDHVVRHDIDAEVVVLTDSARVTLRSEIVSRGARPASVSDFAELRDGIAKAMWPETQTRSSRASAGD